MSFGQCIDNAVDGGALSEDEAVKLKETYKELSDQFGGEVAKSRLSKEFSDRAAEDLRAAELQAKAQAEIQERLDSGLKLTDLVEGIHGAKGKTLRGRHEAFRGLLRGEMSDVLRTFRANLVGNRRNKALLRDVVDELFHEGSGNQAAKELAQSFHSTNKRAIDLFNERGGAIKERADWGLPQSHNQIKVGKVSKAEWMDFIRPMLRREDMLTDAGEVMSDLDIERFLNGAYDAISTNGWSVEGGAGGYRARQALKNKGRDRRKIIFKDAESWLSYQERFGEDDPWRTMVQHIDAMAHDIAHMDVLGPSQESGWQFAKDYVEKQANLTSDGIKIDAGRQQIKQADAMRNVWSGEANQPSSRFWARFMSGTRQYLTSAQLGSAVISSVTDFGNQRVAAGFIGLNKSGHLNFITKLATSEEFRKTASESGLILQNAVDQGQAAMRYSMEDFHVEAAGRLADGVLRVSGLSGLTQMQRDAFGMSVMNDLAKQVDTPFDKLNPKLQRAFDNFGIDADAWDKMRSSELYEVQGVKFLRPNEIEQAADLDTALNFMEFISSNQEFAVPSSSIRAQSIVKGAAGDAGTFRGEAVRSVAQYKSFPMVIAMTHIGRIIREVQEGRPSGAMQYAASFFVASTLLGALAIQTKLVAAGKNPADMTTLEFWGKAGLQGGGLGPFGDFLTADKNRFGGSLAETLAGPTVGLIGDVISLTAGNAREAIQGKDTNIAAEAFKFLSDNTAGQNLWFSRLAFEREIEDQMLSILDPKYSEKVRRKTRRQEREGGGYFWKPGQSVFD